MAIDIEVVLCGPGALWPSCRRRAALISIFYQLVSFAALFLFVLPRVSDTRLSRRIHLLSVDLLYLVVGFITVANFIVRSLAFVTEFEV